VTKRQTKDRSVLFCFANGQGETLKWRHVNYT